MAEQKSIKETVKSAPSLIVYGLILGIGLALGAIVVGWVWPKVRDAMAMAKAKVAPAA